MKQNYLSFTAGIIGGLFLYSGIVTFQNSTSSSTAPTISSFENVQLQESLVDPKTNLKQSTPACTQAQLRCNDYQQDISSLLFISEELFDASKKI
ncbi:MAG: hypothetical protein ACOCQQ_00920 [Candidatus Nanoarchaeia archaeon]